MLLSIVGASGSGKNTLLEHTFPKGDTSKIVTYTTREPRPGEVNGQDYNFITLDKFRVLRAQDYFYETSEYAGNWYGTSNQDLLSAKGTFRYVIQDVNGYNAMRNNKLGVPVVGIHITADKQALTEHLIRRGTSDKVLKDRLDLYEQEAVLPTGMSVEFRNHYTNSDLDLFKRLIAGISSN